MSRTSKRRKSWFVYLVRCSDETFYCGIAKDVQTRVKEHNESKKGAKYTSGRRPVKLVFCEKQPTLSQALKREWAIKKLQRAMKQRMASQWAKKKQRKRGRDE